jgi:hypothetical protein
MSSDTREILNLVLNALTSLGTLAAVIVALYLARAANREILKARVGIRVMMSMGQSVKEGQEVVCATVTNLSSRPITITGIGWRVGILKKQDFLQIHDGTNPVSSRIPQKLDYGDCATYPLDTKHFFDRFETIAPHLSLVWPWLTKRSIYLIVSTSGGDRDFPVRVERALADRFYAEAKKRKKA